MKKILLIVALVGLVIPNLAFAEAVSLGDGSSIDARSTPLSLSPNVEMSYDTIDGNSYALTGGSLKGTVSYGIEAGNQKVYQMPKAATASPVAAGDDGDTEDDQYDGEGTWSAVGK